MLHVEVIQNEWAAGTQRVVGRLTLNGTGDVRVESTGDASWSSTILDPFRDPETGLEVSPQSDAETFVRRLHVSVNGDYLFATEAHEEGECEYPLGHDLPLNAVEVAKHVHEAIG